MKARSVIKFVLMMSIVTSLISCKKEEFYKKEYIKTIKDNYEGSIVEDISNPTSPNLDNSAGSTTGDNGGSTTGDNGVSIIPVSDSFTQSANNKLDILWVIDNSGSMREEQAALAYNFDVFINKFIEKGIDFKMSITTTDTRGNNAGKPVKDSLTKLTSQNLAKNQQQFLQDFANMIQVGTNGWGIEKGIKASEVFSNQFAIKHFRKDAYFVVVYVSDEEDQSEKTPQNHLKQISKWKDNAGLVKAYSIVNISAPYTGSNPYIVSGYKRYEAMSTLTGGYISDINDRFYTTLLKMGNDIAELSQSFPLSQTPYDENNIKVFVEGVEMTSGWVYDAQTKTIKFLPASVPVSNSNIHVTYGVAS